MTESELTNTNIVDELYCFKCDSKEDLIVNSRLKTRTRYICRTCQRKRRDKYKKPAYIEEQTESWEVRSKRSLERILKKYG